MQKNDLDSLMLELTRFRENPIARRFGSDRPATAETAVGLARLRNLRHCIISAESAGVPGDIVETGVWRGGAMIFARAVLRHVENQTRRVWCFDSFEGLPAPDPASYPADEGDPHHTFDWLRVSLEDVRENFRKYALLDDRVQFVKGWFRDTLPAVTEALREYKTENRTVSDLPWQWEHGPLLSRIAVLRLDGDMYESTALALEHLYPLLSHGGFLIVDDWSLTRARAAVNDYRRSFGIKAPLEPIDDYSVFWRRDQTDEGR